jgi:uncharacterized protein
MYHNLKRNLEEKTCKIKTRILLGVWSLLKIALTGGTGLIGKALTKFFLSNGHEIFILTRNRNLHSNSKVTYVPWLYEEDNPAEQLEGVDVIINLAGESINSGRWTDKRKHSILTSRIKATEQVINIIKKLSVKPKVLINASAIGIYGTSEIETFTEQSTITGKDFLATTVQKWEETARAAEAFGVRTAFCRFGIILDKNDGALPRIALPYHLFVGGTIGSGTQWLSWITLSDVVRAIQFIIDDVSLSGPINFTTPTPVQMKQFGESLSIALKRPHWLPVPSIALKALLGEMSILVLEGQKVLPQKLLSSGFQFQHNELIKALENIYED